MSPSLKALIALGIAHATLECFSGVWPVYKYLAGLDPYLAGIVFTVPGFAASILQPAFGHWADRGWARGMLLLGTGLTFLMALLGPAGLWKEELGPGALFALLAALMLLSRLGHSMFHPAGASLAGQALKDRPAAGLGIFVALGWVGYGFSQFVFSAAYQSTGGHSEVLLLPGVLLLLWIAWWTPPAARGVAATHGFRGKFRELWSLRRDVGALFAIMTLVAGSNSALTFLFPELLAAKGYAEWLVCGGAQIFLMGGTALGVLAGGYLADRWGASFMLLLSLGIAFAAYQGFLLLPELPESGFIAVCLVLGLCLGLCQTLPVSMAQAVAPEHASTISGVMMGWAWALASVSPVVAAYLASGPYFGVVGALSVAGVLNLAALGAAILVPYRRPARLAAQV